MARIAYPSDLTDAQRRLIAKRIPPAKPGGRHRSVDLREVMNGILYLSRTGCSWRQLPHDFPPWGTVHFYYWSFRRQGVWQEIHDALRGKVRTAAGRKVSPSAAINSVGFGRSPIVTPVTSPPCMTTKPVTASRSGSISREVK